MAVVSEPMSGDNQVQVALLPATVAGLPAAVVCVLTGASAGALCIRPLLPGRGWSIAATALASLLVLVAAGSPAEAAVTALVTGSRTGTVHHAVVPPVLVVAGGVAALVCLLSPRRDDGDRGRRRPAAMVTRGDSDERRW
ncbi:hypothetical protein [Streptomyces sp. NPDC002133]|uniref:hypothetical protein n=1 Tax=Streptomyces sp. NPDC002133 TaxID=3154409 RepID=UPI003324E32E